MLLFSNNIFYKLFIYCLIMYNYFSGCIYEFEIERYSSPRCWSSLLDFQNLLNHLELDSKHR